MKLLHQVWLQGARNLPAEYEANRTAWRAALPSEWGLRLWDHESAAERWPGIAAAVFVLALMEVANAMNTLERAAELAGSVLGLTVA